MAEVLDTIVRLGWEMMMGPMDLALLRMAAEDTMEVADLTRCWSDGMRQTFVDALKGEISNESERDDLKALAGLILAGCE